MKGVIAQKENGALCAVFVDVVRMFSAGIFSAAEY